MKTKRDRNRAESCRRFRELLLEDLDRTLAADARAALDEHLAGCADCAAERRALGESLALLRKRRAIDPGEAFWSELRGRVRDGLAEPERRPLLPRWSWAPAAVAAILAFFVVWWSFDGRRPGEEAWLAQLEADARRDLLELSAAEGELADLQLAEASDDYLAELLGALAVAPERLDRALLTSGVTIDPTEWSELAVEESQRDLPLEDLIGLLTESELERLSDRLEKLTG